MLFCITKVGICIFYLRVITLKRSYEDCNSLMPPCYSPSLQERRKVRVGSISFFILIRASRIIGPHLHEEEQNQAVNPECQDMSETFL